MIFEKNKLYHIYNQGNNRVKIFYEDRNYDYFLYKLKHYLLPYADILAWCLMPNHFHLMILVREVELFYEKKSKEFLRVSKPHIPSTFEVRAVTTREILVLRLFDQTLQIPLGIVFLLTLVKP